MKSETIDWGVPVQRKTRKTERFETPVVTMAAIAKEGAGRKFSFNKAAQEALGLVAGDDGESFVAFGSSNTDIFVKSSTKEEANMFKLTKSFSFSDKKTFEFIAKKKDLDISVENFLHLEEVEGAGMFKVTSINSEISEVEFETTEKEEELKGLAGIPEIEEVEEVNDVETEITDEAETVEVSEKGEEEATDTEVW